MTETGIGVYMTADLPRLVTVAVSLRAIHTVFISQGPWIGLFSAVLTTICVAPVFDCSRRGHGPSSTSSSGFVSLEATSVTSVPASDTIVHELTNHSTIGRTFLRLLDTLNECIGDLNYVLQVLLRENQGLLLLLIGGISTMALALVAGLEGINGLKAVLISVSCYGITTILVARSARRIVYQQNAALSQKPKLSSAEVTRIVEAIPEENFVQNDDLNVCDRQCLINMLLHRKIIPPSDCDSDSYSENSDSTPPNNSQLKKETLIAEIQQRRNYNDTCCICLSPFIREERIRVLPSCRHEFHQCCIDKWAQTFAADKLRVRFDCSAKSGNPTCPLCKTCL